MWDTFNMNSVLTTYLQTGTNIVTHELNNYTMSEAMKFYPQIKKSFAVRSCFIFMQLLCLIPFFIERCIEQNYTQPSFSQCKAP